MKYQHLLFVVIMLSQLDGFAQDFTRRMMGYQFQASTSPVLVVPFEEKMVISDFFQELCAQNQTSAQELKVSLADILEAELSQDPNFQMFSEEEIAIRIQRQQGYKYLPLPDKHCESGEQEDKPKKAFKGVFKGEVKSEESKGLYFMESSIKPEAIQTELNESSAEYVLVITEIDLKYDYNAPMVPGESIMRRYAVHYSIFYRNGELLHSGMMTRATRDNNLVLSHLSVRISCTAFLTRSNWPMSQRKASPKRNFLSEMLISQAQNLTTTIFRKWTSILMHIPS
ncbi:MAG: hypothetical protein HRT74_00165 [Flavobacteriales bacterium]|nr:hypothetical protein [Flavobacteriales bacterium]